MKKLLFIPTLFLFFFLISSCVQEEIEPLAQIDNQEIDFKTAQTVPFSGFYTTYPIGSDPDENGTVTFNIPGEGTATHLGNSTWYSDSQIFGIFGPPPWVQTGTMVFTAANGAELIGYTEGFAAPDPPNPFVGWGDYVITSGTGRFEGYTGSGTYYFTSNPENNGFLEFEGTLTKP